MELTRKGMHRNHGKTFVINSDDAIHIVSAGEQYVSIGVRADRSGASSYEYSIRLTHEEVLRLLCELPPPKIPDAMAGLREKFDLAKIIPEIQKELTIGAMQSQQPAPSISDESGNLFD